MWEVQVGDQYGFGLSKVMVVHREVSLKQYFANFSNIPLHLYRFHSVPFLPVQSTKVEAFNYEATSIQAWGLLKSVHIVDQYDIENIEVYYNIFINFQFLRKW